VCALISANTQSGPFYGCASGQVALVVVLPLSSVHGPVALFERSLPLQAATNCGDRGWCRRDCELKLEDVHHISDRTLSTEPAHMHTQISQMQCEKRRGLSEGQRMPPVTTIHATAGGRARFARGSEQREVQIAKGWCRKGIQNRRKSKNRCDDVAHQSYRPKWGKKESPARQQRRLSG
jgi:hypothetical protein